MMIQSSFPTGSSYALFPLTRSSKYLHAVGFTRPSSVPLPSSGFAATNPCTAPSTPLHSLLLAYLMLRWERTIYSLLKFLNHSTGKKPQVKVFSLSSFLALYQALILPFCSLLFSTPCWTSALFTPPLQPAGFEQLLPSWALPKYSGAGGKSKKTSHKPISAL